ncbi:hypothetical protein [Roseimicrobium sp. ORNL1]|uniref:hypothetical protein n=1 Tax=Roseimicrobium sp. ORNL1 TaxID=2711231 RepID=UPI0013E1328A|nr:hypothetical protein [Roseimicrobium sp. ORNL1]QIF05285.1 hypothetical protein G5S37_28510 [Roseimicrobium sp. ORNL1]
MPPDEPSRSAFELLLAHRGLIALLVLSATVGVFSVVQNSGAIVGGRISPPKIAWLNFALYMFVVLPVVVGWYAPVDAATARLYRIVFWSFLIRGVIEFYMLYVTRSWRCGYGISHDLLTAMLVIIFWQSAGGLTVLLLATLIIEARMAKIFRARVDPATGVYFADNSAHFAAVNRFTWWVNAALYPILGWLLWKNHALFTAA